MANIADRMLELLLFPLTDSQWVQLFHELKLSGSPLSEAERNGQIVLHLLPKLGVRLWTDPNGWVLNVHFLVGPTYLGDLPFGLRPDFSAGDVHQLLGPPRTVNEPNKSESYSF